MQAVIAPEGLLIQLCTSFFGCFMLTFSVTHLASSCICKSVAATHWAQVHPAIGQSNGDIRPILRQSSHPFRNCGLTFLIVNLFLFFLEKGHPVSGTAEVAPASGQNTLVHAPETPPLELGRSAGVRPPARSTAPADPHTCVCTNSIQSLPFSS